MVRRGLNCGVNNVQTIVTIGKLFFMEMSAADDAMR